MSKDKPWYSVCFGEYCGVTNTQAETKTTPDHDAWDKDSFLKKDQQHDDDHGHDDDADADEVDDDDQAEPQDWAA